MSMRKKTIMRKATLWQEQSAYYYKLAMDARDLGQNQYALIARDYYLLSWTYLHMLIGDVDVEE